MKCFVTGGAGFIGSNMASRLLEAGHSVTVYDNFSSGRKIFISSHLRDPKFSLVEADLIDRAKLTESMKGHDIVFHFAANPDVLRGLKEPSLDFENGTIITFNVLSAMRENGVKRIVFSSSGTVYGNTGSKVATEDYGPILPVSLYGGNKVAAEALISGFSHIFGFTAYIFRFANVVGSHQSHGVIYDFINKLKKNLPELLILGDGRQTKHYLLVDELIDAIFYVMEHAKDTVNYFNLSNDTPIDVNSIAQIVIDELRLSNVSITHTGGTQGWKGDVPVSYLSAKKVNALGWKSKMDSREAVRFAARTLIKEMAEGSF